MNKYYQAKFTYSPLGKAFEKKKTITTEENQDPKSIESLFPKEMRTNEIKNGINEIKKWEEIIKRKDLIYKTNNYIYDFQPFEKIKSFSDNIYSRRISIDEAEMDHSNLLENMDEFTNKTRSKELNKEKEEMLFIV